MRKYFSPIVTSLAFAASLASTASAHIQLRDPPARYEVTNFDNGIKSCPCGLGSSNRTCNLAVDSSDPDRSTRVSRFEAGSTITLVFDEFVDHAGRFRVAFDPDGADMADFNANVLEDMPDPAGTGGQTWEIQVTLPNMTCTNCTLQLVQAMEVDVNTPIADPAPISSYYSCVDLELVAPGTLGAPEQPGQEQPGQEQPGQEQPGQEQPAGETDPNAQPPSDEADPSDEPAGEEASGPEPGPGPSNGAQSGGSAAGDMTGTPLIPAGTGTPMDTGSGSGVVAPGAVAMNDPAGAAPGSVGGTLPPPPSIAGSSTESGASGGCALAHAPGGASLGLGLLGLFAAVGLRRRARRAA
jgi:MYXO-CTERM domain-containing protein